MKQVRVFMSMLALVALALYVASCGGDDPEPETLPPTIAFDGGSGAQAQRGTNVNVTINLTAEAGLKSLTVNGTNIPVTVGAAQQSVIHPIAIAANATLGATPYEFIVTDSKDRQANATYTVTVTGAQINLSTFATNGSITTAVTLDAGNTYFLDRRLNVNAGGHLTIPAGTTIYAKTTGLPDGETRARLQIESTGRITANGTASQPIVFTSDKTLTNTAAPGDWEGIRINGATGTNQGSMRYVRIEFAGVPTVGSGEAAVRLNDVREFTFEFIQIYRSAFEGVVHRSGSTIHIKNIITTDCGGRGFHFRDASGGATAQFLIVHARNLTNLISADASIAEGSAIDVRQTATVRLANVTLLGPGRVVESSTMDGIRVWSGTTARLFNFLVAHFPDDGVRIDVAATNSVDANNEPVFTAAPMFAFSRVFQIGDEMLRGGTDNQLFATVAGFGNTFDQSTTPAAAAGITVDSYVPTATITSTNNPSTFGAPFVSAAYVGAIGATDWTAGGWVRNPNGSIRP